MVSYNRFTNSFVYFLICLLVPFFSCFNLGTLFIDFFCDEQDTIKNNIIFDKVITDEQFWKICEIAGLTNFINKLPQKENTIIDESYRNISGGQAQRISIARALVKNPKILLLDESTSQIDTKKEKNILSNIIRNNITVILITHRSENIEALKSQLIVHKLSGKIFRK